MNIKWMILTLLVSGTSAFASGFSGKYQVLPNPHCDLQENTTVKIEATTQTLTLSTFLGTQDAANPYSLVFSATVGDHIIRPNQFDISHGYTTTDRQISSYTANATELNFSEYDYDMSLSDAQGESTGFTRSVEIQQAEIGQVFYAVSYANGEVHQCRLVPLN
jgi:hypothetical protein